MLSRGAVPFSAVHAASGIARFSLRPTGFDPAVPVTQSYFILGAHAGTTLKRSVRVLNSGTATGTAILSAVDATTGQSSGTVFLAANVKQSRVGTWIHLSVQQVTLAPGYSQTVAFEVVIPQNALAGQHVGGIVAADVATASASKNNPVLITIQNLSIIAVQVNLPGPVIEKLSASGIQAGGANGYQRLVVGLSNTGNDMLKPSGSLKVFNAQGQLLQSLSLQLDTFLPDTSIDYPVYMQKQALPPGDDLAHPPDRTRPALQRLLPGEKAPPPPDSSLEAQSLSHWHEDQAFQQGNDGWSSHPSPALSPVASCR